MYTYRHTHILGNMYTPIYCIDMYADTCIYDIYIHGFYIYFLAIKTNPACYLLLPTAY